ncbi:MAG: outer membrane protein assembly factor BamA [Proteobacteria bacterium]|nr:outer membrane protein assembly factor BamA [Pseudomonadota bacterium]MBU1687360.1 outer membrane protein assembly factor BamA [Pseudomonadota bacterium]
MNSMREYGLFSNLNNTGVGGSGPIRLLLAFFIAWGSVFCLPAMAKAKTDELLSPPAVEQPSQPADVVIIITGNHAITSSLLRQTAAEELKNFQTKGFNPSDADDAAYQMEIAYRKRGFRFATVDYTVTLPGPNPQLDFIIKEGPRVRLTEIILSGNDTVPEQTLLAFFTDPEGKTITNGWLVESNLTAGVDAIRTHYAMNGYLRCVVADPFLTYSEDRSTVTVEIKITEGTHFLVRDILFTGQIRELSGDLADLRQELIDRAYVPRRNTLLLDGRITELYGNLGYPDTTVQITRVPSTTEPETNARTEEKPEGDVILAVNIDSGPQVTITDLTITGNNRTNEDFITSRLALTTGDLYNVTKKRTSFSNLYRTGLFSQVQISLMETEQPSHRGLLVEVEELPGRELSFEMGWGSYELLRGKMELRNKNFTGKGRILSASAATSMKSTDLGLGFSDPWLLGHDLALDLPFYYRIRSEPSFDKTETGISTVVSKRFVEAQVGISLAYTLRRTQQSNISVAVTEAAGNDYDFASLKIQTYRDTRDDLFFPSGGYRSVWAAELTDPSLGSTLAFIRCTTANRFFFALGKHTVLATRYDSGFVAPTTEDLTLPLAERFFNGGASSVRSFRESELGPRDPVTGDPSGGSAYNIFSMELRHRFRHNIGGSLFVDYGNIAPTGNGGLDRFTDRSDFIAATFNDYFSGFRPAIGIGLQYLLPVGPLRIDGAYNPTADKNQGESAMIFHFTVGMAF